MSRLAFFCLLMMLSLPCWGDSMRSFIAWDRWYVTSDEDYVSKGCSDVKLFQNHGTTCHLNSGVLLWN